MGYKKGRISYAYLKIMGKINKYVESWHLLDQNGLSFDQTQITKFQNFNIIRIKC